MDAHIPNTLHEAISYFSNPDNCLKTAIGMRWPDGPITCPTCGSKEVTLLATRQIWKCKTKHPKQQFSAKVGTIFEDSPIGLDKWFTAIWLISNCKNGVSSCEIARDLGVTQKTGWFMLHRIRKAMQDGTFVKAIGDFEVDESFIGGAARFMHKNKKAKITGTGGTGGGKAVVMGPVGSQDEENPLATCCRYQRADASRRRAGIHRGRFVHLQRRVALVQRPVGRLRASGDRSRRKLCER
jgi:transposase-like protein